MSSRTPKRWPRPQRRVPSTIEPSSMRAPSGSRQQKATSCSCNSLLPHCSGMQQQRRVYCSLYSRCVITPQAQPCCPLCDLPDCLPTPLIWSHSQRCDFVVFHSQTTVCLTHEQVVEGAVPQKERPLLLNRFDSRCFAGRRRACQASCVMRHKLSLDLHVRVQRWVESNRHIEEAAVGVADVRAAMLADVACQTEHFTAAATQASGASQLHAQVAASWRREEKWRSEKAELLGRLRVRYRHSQLSRSCFCCLAACSQLMIGWILGVQFLTAGSSFLSVCSRLPAISRECRLAGIPCRTLHAANRTE